MPFRRIPFLANHYYHIYNRGVNRGDIFFSPDNYIYFLRLLKKNLGRYAISIVAYCLLLNHYHFLLKPERDNNLPLFIKSLFGSYSQAVNKQQGRQGPLFQGRYRAIWVDEEEYLVHLARYIHLNPVTAGLVVTPQAWPYSNYLDVIGQRAGTLKDTTLVPERFPTGDAYRQFVKDYLCHGQTIAGLEKYLLE
ncbi:MAG: transposase [Anaerolineae bacterium]|nr:transposase [Anaerolineae bacterium]